MEHKKFKHPRNDKIMVLDENNGRNVNFSTILDSLTLTVYGGGIPSIISSSRSRSKLSWFVAIDGSELDFTSCGKFPSESDVGGPGLSSKSDSGLEA